MRNGRSRRRSRSPSATDRSGRKEISSEWRCTTSKPTFQVSVRNPIRIGSVTTFRRHRESLSASGIEPTRYNCFSIRR